MHAISIIFPYHSCCNKIIITGLCSHIVPPVQCHYYNQCNVILEFGKNLFDHKDTSKLKDQVSWKLFNDTLQGPPMSLSHSSTSQFRTGGGGSRHRPMARRSQPPIQQMGGGRLLTYFGLPEDPLSNVIIFNDSMSLQPVFMASTFPSSLLSSSSNTFSSLAFIVILNDVYLINHLSFDLLDSDVHGALSYAVEISKGGETQSDWLRLMDYSQYSCYGKQELRFPKQAIKYVNWICELLCIHSIA